MGCSINNISYCKINGWDFYYSKEITYEMYNWFETTTRISVFWITLYLTYSNHFNIVKLKDILNTDTNFKLIGQQTKRALM